MWASPFISISNFRRSRNVKPKGRRVAFATGGITFVLLAVAIVIVPPHIEEERQIKILLDNKSNSAVIEEALKSLARIRSTRSIPFIIARIEKAPEKDGLIPTFFEFLVEIGEESTPFLFRLIEEDINSQTNVTAVRSLVEISRKSPSTREALIEYCEAARHKPCSKYLVSTISYIEEKLREEQ
jgi:hypothetical protein